jgi:hypothetical protein
MCELDRGRPADAVKVFQDGLALPDLSPEARRAVQFELGAAHEAAGSVLLALEQYQQVAREDASFRDVTARIRRLGGNVPSKSAVAKPPAASKPPPAAPGDASQTGTGRNRKIGFI